jgi:class 3 adenylate cyclase
MPCTRCGAENREGARFCEECGAQAEVTCPGCGTGVTPGKRFCGDCGAALAGVAPSPGARQAGASRQASASLAPADERRWATVLFADLTGYTSLSEQMDPEDVQELTHRCAERLSSEVRRFGGTVVNVMGDGVLAVFGAPLAHEDDAERAVRAALAIRDCSLATLEGHPLQLHVGVNTGEVMAGLVGPEEHRDYTVVGDAVNTAARLMAAAPAGCVLVGEETYRATHRTVGYRAVDPVEARGKERPVLAWEALDASTVPEARPLGTAPFVGRTDELAALTRIWTEAMHDARPRLVTVLGEPGIGKSRLVAELKRRALGDAAVFHGRCLPYGTVLGYWAIATLVNEAAGIVAEDNPRAARAKLGELVAGLISTGPGKSDGDPSEVARHLALLVGLDVEHDRAVPAGDQRTLHVSARRFFEALARRRPLCLLLEDIHWADDALLDLIEHVAARASEAPLMIVTQARPELLEHRPSWGRGVPAHTSLRLEPLGERDGHGLILALCREHGLPQDVAEQVGRGAGGNPLFAEELVATIAERRGGSGHVPSAIKALISARLDALSADQRWVLQCCSWLRWSASTSGRAASGCSAAGATRRQRPSR